MTYILLLSKKISFKKTQLGFLWPVFMFPRTTAEKMAYRYQFC